MEKKIFDLSQLEEIVEKFEARISASQEKVARLQADYKSLEVELDSAIEADIMEGSAKTTKDIQNLSGRIQNIKMQLDIEEKTLTKAKELRTSAVAGAINEFKQSYTENIQAYYNDIEKPIFEELAKIRERQYEMLLQVLDERYALLGELHSFDDIVDKLGMQELMYKPTIMMFQNNLFLPSNQFPELGNPLINCSQLTTLKDVYERNQAEVNARVSIDRKRAEKFAQE